MTTAYEVDLLAEFLGHSGYQLVLRRLEEQEAMLLSKLRHPNTDNDATMFIRGQLRVIESLKPEALQKQIREAERLIHQSDTP